MIVEASDSGTFVAPKATVPSSYKDHWLALESTLKVYNILETEVFASRQDPWKLSEPSSICLVLNLTLVQPFARHLVGKIIRSSPVIVKQKKSLCTGNLEGADWSWIPICIQHG